MEVTVQIPDDIAGRMKAGCEDLSRRALEALVAEEFRHGHLNKPDLRRLLGFETSYEIDGFLKAHGVYEDFTMEDVERDVADLKSLGTKQALHGQYSQGGHEQPEGQPLKPKKSAYGLLAQYGPGPTEEEIDENRREMFSGFGDTAP